MSKILVVTTTVPFATDFRFCQNLKSGANSSQNDNIETGEHHSFRLLPVTRNILQEDTIHHRQVKKNLFLNSSPSYKKVAFICSSLLHNRTYTLISTQLHKLHKSQKSGSKSIFSH